MFTNKGFLVFLLVILSGMASANISADFTPDKASGCPPLVVNFASSPSAANAACFWDFGNGNTSKLKNPSATFLASGIYYVKLTVKNGDQVDSMVKTIQVFKLPVANFYLDKPSACSYDIIHFHSNVTLGDAPVTNYAWGFGNGEATSDTSPAYRYKAIGAYDVTLVVQDSNGCSGNKTILSGVKVSTPPVASFTTSPLSACNPTQQVTFTNHSTGNGISYSWNLAPNVISTEANPSYTYNKQKQKVILSVTDTNGCVATASTVITAVAMSADFSASKLLICTGEKVQFTNTSNFPGTSWHWDFGDGTTANIANPVKVYENPGLYDVKFSISEANCADSVFKPKYMNVRAGAKMQPPTISADTTQSCSPPLTVHFTSNAPGAIAWLWDFGDGGGSYDADPTYTFTTADVFTLSLTVMDTSGCIVAAVFPNYISTAGPSTKFKAVAIGCPEVPVAFASPGGKGTTYVWDFGDGGTSTLANPLHTYANYGTYNVKLKATSNIGCVNQGGDGQVLIDSVHMDFKVSSTFSPCPPLVGVFENTTLRKDLKFTWYFGDGYSDTAHNPTHIYFFPGRYSVTLVGVAPSGCTDTLTYKDLILVQGPTAAFQSNPTSQCLPVKVDFVASLSPDTKTVWSDLGDGTLITDSTNFTHIYTQEGVFHPQFVLTDYVGCTVSYPLDSIITHPVPVFTVSDTSVCKGSQVKFSLESPVDKYRWTPAQFISCDSCKDVTITSPDTITYAVAATNQYQCQTKQNVTINVEPLPHLLDSTSINLCKSDSLRLYVGDAASIIWSPSTYLDAPNILNPVCNPLSSVTYSVTASNHLGCSVATKVAINVSNTVSIIPPDEIKVCPWDTVQLRTTVGFGSALGVQYSWSPSKYMENDTTADPVVMMKDKSVTFQVIANSGHCIADTETVLVFVHPTPDIEVSAPVVTTPYAEVPLYAASHEDLNYTWFSQDSFSCNTCRRTTIYPSVSQTVYVEGKNQYGCVVKDSVPIQLTSCDPASIYMPNTFTPNGDGMNDQFLIRTTALASLKYFRVFDQWGAMVFETDQLTQGWDGSVNGKNESTGVYVYVLEGKCQNGYDIIKSGNVTAIR